LGGLVDRAVWKTEDHDNQTTELRPPKRGAGRCESRFRSPAARVSDFARLRGGDPARHAVPIPSRNAHCAARSASRRGCHSAVRLLGRDIPGGRHARARSKAHHHDRPDWPYRFSRNPIYLAFSLFHLGIAIWVNSVWLLATLVGAMALMQYFAIRREEEYLERRFAAQYVDYKASVRRWL